MALRSSLGAPSASLRGATAGLQASPISPSVFSRAARHVTTRAAEPDAPEASVSTPPTLPRRGGPGVEIDGKYYERIGGLLVEFDGPPKPNELRGGRMPDAARVRGKFNIKKAGTITLGTLTAFWFVLFWVTGGFGTL